MKTIKLNDTGVAVEDVQQRLAVVGLLPDEGIDGVYGQGTADAVRAFRAEAGLAEGDEIDAKTWAALVDASFRLGDRTLYLRMPYFHGHDVLELQQALGALGFSSGNEDGIFGAYTEDSVRRFQQNMGLPSDGIVGAYTYEAIRNLHHSWVGKKAIPHEMNLGLSRVAEVLERSALCLFGTDPFTRSVANRMSNLAMATNPSSKVVSAESLLVPPDGSMLFVHIVLPGEVKRTDTVPYVRFADENTLALHISQAIEVAKRNGDLRISVELPGDVWEDAGADRSAQHYAIALLDGLCAALQVE